jgi:A/G-specific adenine glycosylase
VTMPEIRTQQVGANLLRWFAENQRKLPWRLHHRPYEIWISEIMLQQTQVRTMLPYYTRWMQRFPHVQGVALAPEEELLKCWEGMGYYARARNIQKTAQILVEDYDSRLPRSYDQLLKLPGIGCYTAGAIMSIAFNADCPAVDGNVARVLARLFDLKEPLGERDTRQALWDIAERILPKGKARRFNQALMDLGALVCTPKSPSCHACPLRAQCRGLHADVVNERPLVGKTREIIPLHVAVGILLHEGEVFIQKRPPSGLMPHLWEFPGGKLKDGETPESALLREFQEELEVRICSLRKVALIRHRYTTFRVTLHAFICSLEDAARQPVLRSAVEGRWVAPVDLDRYAFPAANRKLIAYLQGRPTAG